MGSSFSEDYALLYRYKSEKDIACVYELYLKYKNYWKLFIKRRVAPQLQEDYFQECYFIMKAVMDYVDLTKIKETDKFAIYPIFEQFLYSFFRKTALTSKAKFPPTINMDLSEVEKNMESFVYLHNQVDRFLYEDAHEYENEDLEKYFYGLLTPIEVECTKLYRDGKTIKEIKDDVHCCASTVHRHLNKAKKILQAIM